MTPALFRVRVQSGKRTPNCQTEFLSKLFQLGDIWREQWGRGWGRKAAKYLEMMLVNGVASLVPPILSHDTLQFVFIFELLALFPATRPD